MKYLYSHDYTRSGEADWMSSTLGDGFFKGQVEQTGQKHEHSSDGTKQE